jgi:hypothetical protein
MDSIDKQWQDGTREHLRKTEEIEDSFRAATSDTQKHVEVFREPMQAFAEKARGFHEFLDAVLKEADRQKLAGIVIHEDEPLSAELLEGALEALRHRRQISQREGEIKRGIVEAERRNDVAALLRLKQEKLELDRKLASGT